MKYLIIITSLRGGGAERVASMLANYLDNKNNEVNIYLLDGGDIDYILNKDVKVYNFPLYKLSKGILRLIFLPIQALYLVYMLKKHKIDKKISFINRANIVNYFASFFFKDKLIVSERSLFSYEYHGIKKSIMKYLLTKSYSNNINIIAISNEVKKELVDNLGVHKDAIEIIHNPVDSKFYNHNILKRTDEDIVFITVGRLIKSKRVDIVINVFAELVKLYPNAKLNILGDGVEKDNLLELVEKLKLTNSISFLGFRKNLDAYLKNADIFLFASEYESFGNVMIEAAAARLLLIIPDELKTAKEIFSIKDEVIFYEKEKLGTLVQRVDLLLKDRKLEEYKNRAYMASLRFNQDTILEKYEIIINNTKRVEINAI